ncbi:acetyl-CoA carboxylase [Halomonas sp. V046]|uniref:acetyl-CoA carboxylase n=1 Tax=Halomonas sp. V046 TaxID=3459611 RepID=UPI004043E3EB
MSQHVQQAPFPGVFYRRSSPEADNFVEPGADVAAGDTIGLLEVMKQFFEVKADVAGRLLSFGVEDGDVVDAGQDIAVIDAGEAGA